MVLNQHVGLVCVQGGVSLLNICSQATRQRKLSGLMLALAILIFPVQASAAPLRGSHLLVNAPAWVPLEDESEIRRRQYPEHYPVPLILPDLLTLPPSDISLVVDPNTGRKSIRFSNSVLNAGPGVLEVHGDLDPGSGKIHVIQIVNRADGTQLERPAGEFHYHADHGHMHWHAFSLYQIWSALPDGSLDRVRASSDKVGYCLRDVAPYLPSNTGEEGAKLENAPTQPGYTSCYWRRQGLSVGWYDIYRAHISGQSLDINHLEDGLYALISTVDPTQELREGDVTNNSTVIYFRLQEDQITLLGETLGQSGQ